MDITEPRAAPLSVSRSLFALPDEVAYLNCSYMAPQLQAVSEAGRQAVTVKQQPWRIRPQHFFEGLEALRTEFAALAGLDADGVTVGPSVSYAMSTAAANITIASGERIIVLADEFPSGYYPWAAKARDAEAEIVTIPWPVDGDWTSAVCSAIDERTAVVAVPGGHWTDGSRCDLVAVGAAARAAGARLVVDASQQLGAMPLDFDAIEPDVVATVGYKWLLGPFNLAFAWFAPDLRDGRPLEGNWLSRAGSEDFNRLVDYTDAFQPGARRYDMGEAASFLHVPMARTALAQLQAWGIDRVAATVQSSVDRIVADAENLGLSATPAAHRSPHMVGLRLPDGAADDLPARLAAADVHVSLRGGSVRVSPHVYNTDEELGRLRTVLAAAV